MKDTFRQAYNDGGFKYYLANTGWVFIMLIIFCFCFPGLAQDESDLDKIRTESGIDPTRVMSRIGYTFLIQNPDGEAGQITNRISLNLGVNRWSFSAKYEAISKTTGIPGSGFESSFGDVKFNILNAFYVEGPHALAGAVEFSVPFGKSGFGSQYFSMMPSITYSYTINPSLFLAFQPQYIFDLMKDPVYPELSVLTVRSFLAKFWQNGFFVVIEPRPIYDFTSENFDLIISPILGKALGEGYNLIFLAEFPTKKETYNSKGPLYQFGFNKAF